VTYREKLLKAYEESLKAYGVNEATLRSALLSFETGFNAGMLYHENDEIKQEMVDNLTQEPNIN
jgi:hypothetical protein